MKEAQNLERQLNMRIFESDYCMESHRSAIRFNYYLEFFNNIFRFYNAKYDYSVLDYVSRLNEIL